MKVVCIVVAALAIGAPASAQFGALNRALEKAQKVEQAKQKLDELVLTGDEEQQIGADVSLKIRQRFGVVQDQAVHKYVTEVGLLLARQSERPNLPWTFIVLDTDGVNAFASPGGFVHITRGALGLIKNEAELAGVLAHEITHVAHEHTVNAIRKNRLVQFGTNETLSDRAPLLEKIANKAYEMILENAFDRSDELDADQGGVELAAKLGYAPGALGDFLVRLDERNNGREQRNGLFASHPKTKERIEKVRQLVGSKTGAIVASRYAAAIKFQVAALTEIAVVTEGSAGLAGSDGGSGDKKDESAKQSPPKKKRGFGLGVLTQTVAPEQQTAQVSASGGARGVGPDRLAKGGDNPTLVKVAVTANELADFKKGIA